MEEKERKTLDEFLAFPLFGVSKGVRSKLVELDVKIAGYCHSLLTFGKIQRIRTFSQIMRDMEFLRTQTDELLVRYNERLREVLMVIMKYGG
ncbi:MAG: hypothetical protein J6C23_06385 [Clostridia bacterium]|nr:hypothetical protein [Clostridia bacterium]